MRFHAARRIVAAGATADSGGGADLAAAVLVRTLEVDSEEARSAAFQLLAAAPEARRAELAERAFGERRQDPEATQAFLATVLGAWGPDDEAHDQLRAAWERSRVESLQRAAWSALARSGDPAALAAARDRLEHPLADSPLPLPAAALWSAVHAQAGEGAARWTAIAAALETTGKSAAEGEISQDLDADLTAARKTLEELADHLGSLSGEADDGSAECPSLHALVGRSDKSTWAARRRLRLGCRDDARVLMRSSIPRPGPYAFELLDLLGRLQVGSEIHDQVFHAVYETLSRKIDRWAGDPVTTASTGVDLEAPWELSWRDEAKDGGDSSLGSTTWQLSSSDPERLLDTVLRATSGRLDLERLGQGVFSSHAVALVPMTLVGFWVNEQTAVSGSDQEGSTPQPTETYVALEAAGPSSEEAGAWVLHHLEIGDDGPRWRRTHLRRQGRRVTVTDAAEETPASSGDRAVGG